MSGDVQTRTGFPVRKGLPVTIQRITGLGTAASLLGGQEALAKVLGLETRSLRSKLDASRGISDTELTAVAAALDARALLLVDFATKLRGQRAPVPQSQEGAICQAN